MTYSPDSWCAGLSEIKVVMPAIRNSQQAEGAP